MKTRSMIAFAGTLFLTGSLAQAASYKDITISDGLLAGVPSGYPTNANGLFGPSGTTDPRFTNQSEREFSEVENGNVEHANWDLRAFGFDSQTNTLIYQGGMDISRDVNGSSTPSGAVTSSNQILSGSYGIGSIFIKIGTDSDFQPPIWSNNSTAPATSGNYQLITNGSLPGDGFDYAVTLLTGTTGGSLKYIIYDLNANSQLRMPYFDSNDEAGPYVYRPEDNVTNTTVGSLQTTGVLTFSSQQVNDLDGDLQGFGVDNYIASFNLSAIGTDLQKGAYFYLTQECGNDSMVGQLFGTSLVVVPEPANMLGLMGLMVGGAFLRSRRRA